MSILKQVLIFLGLSLVVFLTAYIFVLRYENSLQQHAIEQENVRQKQLKDFLDRASSSYISKDDFNQFLKQQGIDIATIKADLSKLGGDIHAITTVQAQSTTQEYHSGGTVYVNVPTPPTYIDSASGKVIDVNGYYGMRDTLALNEKFIGKDVDGKDVVVQIPFGETTFIAQNKKGDEWDTSVYGRKYTFNTVIANSENRERTFTYNQLSIDVKGTTYKIPIEAQTQELYPTASWKWYLHPAIGLSVGMANYEPALNAHVTTSLAAFGKWNKTPEFRILNLGVGFDALHKDFNLTFQPVDYNIGEIIPFVRNTYLTAGFNFGVSQKSIGFDVGIKVEL